MISIGAIRCIEAVFTTKNGNLKNLLFFFALEALYIILIDENMFSDVNSFIKIYKHVR